MIPSSLQRLKPAARARTQVLLAALLWTCVGVGLLAAGTLWMSRSHPPWLVFLLALAAAIGLAKGHLLLSRTARKAAARIARRGDGTCLGGFLSWQSWLFVLCMMGTGAVLRRSALPRTALGVVYVAVGIALLWGSRVFWAEWRRLA
ncbi:MAG TPA: hypothetical protein VK997_08230 [Deferrisomatales bacterium]|nr:hypothetical protein [Deferrisomatales bacterium]